MINISKLCCYMHICLLSGAFGFSSNIPENIATKTPHDVQKKAVELLIVRCVGQSVADNFAVKIDKSIGSMTFKLKSENGKIILTGDRGVSVAKGFHYYMKYYLHKDISWINGRIELPANVKLPSIDVISQSNSGIIYYQNVCVWSYSFAWWDFSSWRQHIDWMAMQGISLTIAPIQESIWQEVYKMYGLTDDEIKKHFAGPGFQAWQRMGNIRGWAGPLPTLYMQMQQSLQSIIIKAQRELGISIALPAFSGHVPVAMKRIFPNVKFTVVERWNNFPNHFCCSLFVKPNQPLFEEIAQQFLNKVIDIYGTNHIYFTDPFNEIQPPSSDVSYMNMTSFYIYESMKRIDDKAIWLLQGWMFVKNIFWTDNLIEAFLKAVPIGKLLVLDLQSEQFPQYERTYSYHGQPFIWCMLHNFGGTLGMHGSVNIINERIKEAREMENSTMIGVGMTPEGINQNYVIYSLLLERAWEQNDLNLYKWFDIYSDVRYGVKDDGLRAAYQYLRKSVYSFHGIRRLRGKYAITKRPALNLNPWTWYNTSDVHKAWMLILSANASIPISNYANYEHDLVDITRQFLQSMSDRLYVNLMASYKKRDSERFSYIAIKMITLFEDLEEILATNEQFLLGVWLSNAKKMAQTNEEIHLYEFNARNQITGWGPDGQIVDYATKQWSGIVVDYYQPRWKLFLEMLLNNIVTRNKFNSTLFKYRVKNEIENPFSFKTNEYPITGTGHVYKTSKRIFVSWTAQFDLFDFLNYLQVYVPVFA